MPTTSGLDGVRVGVVDRVTSSGLSNAPMAGDVCASRWMVGVGAVLCAATQAACGPLISVSFMVDAEAKVAAAKAAEADRFAPYEYTSAQEYLQKAHEELGYADYGPAIDYAYKAADAAKRGVEKASAEKAKYLDAALPATSTTLPATSKGPVTIQRVAPGTRAADTASAAQSEKP
jgi:hypothetical protein